MTISNLKNKFLHWVSIKKSSNFLNIYSPKNFHTLFKINKITIFIEAGNFVFDNDNTNKIIYDFFLAQQDLTKRLLQMELPVPRHYKEYISEYIMAIKSKKDYRYDMLKHRNSKFLFYNFNGFLNRINKPVQLGRDTTVADKDHASIILQKK